MTAARKRRRYERDASNSHKLDLTVCDGPVKRDLLQQTYAVVSTLREYALLSLPSNSRLRRKKISSLGRVNPATELETNISNFLDSTLICDVKSSSKADSTTYTQWLSFSQNGDESHVTISGGISDSKSTQSEVRIYLSSLYHVFFFHVPFPVSHILVPNGTWLIR